MTALILGIDCGKTGALAWVDQDGALVHLADMPDADHHALGARVRDLLVEHPPLLARVERTQAFPGQGLTSAHDYGRNAGAVLGALGAWDVPTELVEPSKWKGAAGLTKRKGETTSAWKTRSRQRATELYPAWSTWFARVKDDGRAEAALVARHGWLAYRNEAA